MLFVIPTRMDSKETPGWNSQYSCIYLDGREGTAPLLLNVHTALSFLIQLSTVYANNVVRITGQILLFSGESADSGPAFGNTNSCVLSAGYTVCVKLNQCFQGCWFRIVLLLHYGKNKNRIGHCESVCFTSWKWVVHLMFEKRIIAGQLLWDTGTLGQRREQAKRVLQTDQNQRQTILPLIRNIVSLKENVAFFPLSFTIQTHSNLAEQGRLGKWMVLDPAALASRITAWWGSSTSLMWTENTLGGCPEAGNKKQAECLQELSGRTRLSWWAPQAQCVKHHPWWSHWAFFPSDPTVAAFPVSKDAVPWKSTNGKNASIFKCILDKMANCAQKEFETCTSCYVFHTGMFWQMDAFRQRN